MIKRVQGPRNLRGLVQVGNSGVQGSIPTMHLNPYRDMIERGLPVSHLRPAGLDHGQVDKTPTKPVETSPQTKPTNPKK